MADVDVLIPEVERSRAALLQSVAGLTDVQAAFKPGEAQWSIAEILEHLIPGRVVGRREELGRQLQGTNLEDVVFPPFLSGPLDARQRLEFLRFQIERHVGQIERVRASQGSPAW